MKKSYVILILIVVLGGIFFYLKTKPLVSGDKNTITDKQTDFKTYSNPTAGIEFKYPTSWGNYKQAYETGCQNDYNSHNWVKPTGDPRDPCQFLAGEFSYVDFKATTKLYAYNPVSHGGTIGDPSLVARGGDSISNFCLNTKSSEMINCSVYKTQNNVQVEKLYLAKLCPFDDPCLGPHYIYYIKTPNTIWPGLSFTVPAEHSAEVEKAIESLNFTVVK